MATKSLKAQQNKIAIAQEQLKVLNSTPFSNGVLPTFQQKLAEGNQFPLTLKKLDIFQVNIGYMCNQVCEHCHVDAGPDRKEIMTIETMQQCLDAIKISGASTVDITGGAPEMNPNFRWFIEEINKLGVEDIIVRSNLTIIVANKKYYDLPEFFKANNVHVISSLPCYTKENVDKQRGKGVFADSIKALKMLNDVGYGIEGTGLKLDLVYNPGGPSLPGSQEGLQADYKRELKELFGIEFNYLFTITNLPISRFLDFLMASERYEEYMEKLVTNFNPYAVDGVMCRETISVSWDGYIYDCDFNQMLALKVASKSNHIRDFSLAELAKRDIIISQHCYGCTAGAGSSCQGVTV
ncbi:MAG: arsenosugar biosynthesis radical SAM protein ArsS [Flavobacteriales bacterium]|jgi:radical SAM/Cys-rich protein|nr:arsenosugar biosynthesis radical SAM protein ArsS [Flavobacteriales bacterium]